MALVLHDTLYKGLVTMTLRGCLWALNVADAEQCGGHRHFVGRQKIRGSVGRFRRAENVFDVGVITAAASLEDTKRCQCQDRLISL